MSSLLQHHGGRSEDGRKVELFLYRVEKGEDWEAYCGPDSYNPSPESMTFCNDAEPVTFLGRSDGEKTLTVPRLYRIYRRPAGMFGPWVVFRYNGAEHVPDLSVPIRVFNLPRDAKPISEGEAQEYWRSS